MKIWETFLPKNDDIDVVRDIASGPYFVDPRKDPLWGTVYFPCNRGIWIALSWNYFDIEFKFETYGMSLEVVDRPPATLIEAGSVPEFERIDFCTRTEWTRPATHGEVPAHYEQIIEESGRASDMPRDAISAGTSLYAVAFRSVHWEADRMISIDEDARCSLKASDRAVDIAATLQSCDVFDDGGILAWKPPV